MKYSINSNKAQVEIQFNWIFILIVGAIILAFFVTVSLKQKQSSEQQMNINFFTNFEKAITGISAAQGKMYLLDVPNMDLRYDCTSDCDCAAYAGTSRAKAVGGNIFAMNDRIIFSPNRLKGNVVFFWSKDWTFPFRITNLLFMTSPEVKYLIEGTPRGQAIFETLPPIFMEREQKEERAFDKQLFDAGQSIEGIKGNYKVKFVFTETNPENFNIPAEVQSLANSDVTAIKIESSQGSERVIFYQKDSTNKLAKTGESYLFGDATIYAAIFAEDLNAYGCMMNRAMKSLNMVSKIYHEKLGLYSDKVKKCQIHYVSGNIENITMTSEDFDFKSDLSNPSDLEKSSNAFASQNDNALKDSCPHIY